MSGGIDKSSKVTRAVGVLSLRFIIAAVLHHASGVSSNYGPSSKKQPFPPLIHDEITILPTLPRTWPPIVHGYRTCLIDLTQ